MTPKAPTDRIVRRRRAMIWSGVLVLVAAMVRAKAGWLVAVLAAFMLGACYESPDVELHKPGVYKGARDPLVEKQRGAGQQERLQMRFNQIQTDR